MNTVLTLVRRALPPVFLVLLLLASWHSRTWPAWSSAISTTRYVAPTGSDTGNDCQTAANPCATIAHAMNQAGAGDTISLAAGDYTEAGLTVAKNLTITGAGADSTFVQAAASPGIATDRGFSVTIGIQATMQNLTVRNGKASAGGGIYNNGTLSLATCRVSGNGTTPGSQGGNGGPGGGIYSKGALTLTNCSVSGNSTGYGGFPGPGDSGGGVYNRGDV